MVARITIPKSIKQALNYNEQKLKEGKARCLYANLFIKDAVKLNFYDKLNRFERHISLNQRAKSNTLHISLNFSPGEKFEHEKLTAIANSYMQKIGFDNQPYLVYQHLDAGHPHLHIVATNITSQGKRLSLHNLGKDASNIARKEIETEFNLLRAEDRPKIMDQITAIQTQKIHYGKTPTKRAISNVIQAVIPYYKYASLPELNAILKLYNLVADRGQENGLIYKNNGLVYRVLDEDGNKIGVPIKASSLPGQPTLTKLNELFVRNRSLKESFRKATRVKIDWTLAGKLRDLTAFKEALKKEQIMLIPRENEKGLVYGLTYIDLQNKIVFNGSEIGKAYSAKGISEKLQGITPLIQPAVSLKPKVPSASIPFYKFPSKTKDLIDLMRDVLQPVEIFEPMTFELRRRKRKKRKS